MHEGGGRRLEVSGARCAGRRSSFAPPVGPPVSHSTTASSYRVAAGVRFFAILRKFLVSQAHFAEDSCVDVQLVILGAISILGLVTAGVSLYLQARAGSTADLHVRVTGLRTEVSALSDHLDRLDQRERTRRMRDGREKAEAERAAAATDGPQPGLSPQEVVGTPATLNQADRRKLLRQRIAASRFAR